MYSRAAISKQANIVNSNSLTFARALSSGNNEINNAILVDYNHVPRQYWPARFCLATVKSRDNCCKTDSFSWESSINLDLDFLFLFSFSFFFYTSFLSWNKVTKGEVTTFVWICVKAKVKMIDRLGIDVKLWLNISFNFQQRCFFQYFVWISILRASSHLLCIFFGIVESALSLNVRRVFFIIILDKVCLIKKGCTSMNCTLIIIRDEKIVSLLNVINPRKKKESITISNWFIFEMNNDNLMREKTMWNC